jgi:divalent metal cation (Fe/Co/Zn/Cd) transporter
VAARTPGIFAIFCEDAAALAGLSIALIGVSLAYFLEMPVFDALASIAIGVLLVFVAAFLARETLSLMTGESASVEVLADVRAVLDGDPRVVSVDEILSMHLGPEEILVAIAIDFRDEMTSVEIEAAALELGDKLKRKQPAIARVYMRPLRHRDADLVPDPGAA